MKYRLVLVALLAAVVLPATPAEAVPPTAADLAADCAADGRYEFMFTSAPLNLPSGVASPPNALAIK